MTDTISLLQDLIRCPSVTPKEEGVLGVLEKILIPMGFTCERMVFGEGEEQVQNLYAKKGSGNPHFCFAGHVDVVPEGEGWSYPPFGAEIHDGRLYGRGAMDMKSGIACFIKAVEDFSFDKGAISLLITGNEEGLATYGTPAMLDELVRRGESWTACLVGEPCGTEKVGELIKTGRRGSLNAVLTVTGKSGHTGYPHLAVNAVEILTDILAEIRKPLDKGSENFEPSTLSVTSIDVGNPAANVIPSVARAMFNVRFNDLQTFEDLDWLLREKIEMIVEEKDVSYVLETECSGNAFLIPQNEFLKQVVESIKEVTGAAPIESTSGGTSDARFIYKHCPVLECGIPGQGMHGPDESIAVADIDTQIKVYRRILEKFFG